MRRKSDAEITYIHKAGNKIGEIDMRMKQLRVIKRYRDLSQECKGLSAYKIVVIYYYINRLKRGKDMIISVDAEKAFYQIQHTL